MQGYKIDFNIYAETQEEVDALREMVCKFIDEHRMAGRAVTAAKLTEAIKKLETNSFVKNRVNNFFK